MIIEIRVMAKNNKESFEPTQNDVLRPSACSSLRSVN
jgi:hypothetical protein